MNAVMLASPAQRASGLVTASAGNMAQGVAWAARALGLPATIVVPETAPEAKLAAIERLGGTVRQGALRRLVEHDRHRPRRRASTACSCTPSRTRAVIAGNGTIGLEILDDLPDPDAVVIPYGGGGLTGGIASAIKALRPQTRIITVEPDGGAAMAAAMRGRASRSTIDFRPSFVDGAGSRRVLDSMWPLVAPLVDDALAIRLGRGAAAVADAGRARPGDRRRRRRAGARRRAVRPRPAAARSSASCPAATSTSASWPRSSASGLTPDHLGCLT